jgi:hypothetical protein
MYNQILLQNLIKYHSEYALPPTNNLQNNSGNIITGTWNHSLIVFTIFYLTKFFCETFYPTRLMHRRVQTMTAVLVTLLYIQYVHVYLYKSQQKDEREACMYHFQKSQGDGAWVAKYNMVDTQAMLNVQAI